MPRRHPTVQCPVCKNLTVQVHIYEDAGSRLDPPYYELDAEACTACGTTDWTDAQINAMDEWESKQPSPDEHDPDDYEVDTEALRQLKADMVLEIDMPEDHLPRMTDGLDADEKNW